MQANTQRTSTAVRAEKGVRMAPTYSADAIVGPVRRRCVASWDGREPVTQKGVNQSLSSIGCPGPRLSVIRIAYFMLRSLSPLN